MKYYNLKRNFLLCLKLYKSYALVRGRVRVNAPENFTFGSHCHFGHDVFIDCTGGVSFGDGVILANNVKIMSYNHNFRDRSMIPYDAKIVSKSVTVEDGCWLGQGALIAPGALIGRGSVVGMGAVVGKQFGRNNLLVGNPATSIRELKEASTLYMTSKRRSSFIRILFHVSVR